MGAGDNSFAECVRPRGQAHANVNRREIGSGLWGVRRSATKGPQGIEDDREVDALLEKRSRDRR